MLKSIDVLIGLTVIVLALSMAVTVVTQALTTMFNSRGRHLHRGLSDLLQQLDAALDASTSDVIATALLTHPLVSGSSVPAWAGADASPVTRAVRWLRNRTGGPRLGNVLHREEFTKLLMALAADPSGSLAPEVRAKLQTALSGNGVSDPAAALAQVRNLALQLEASSPALSASARQSLAMLHAGSSDLVAKIHDWFDQTIDRTAQRFTASTRVITFCGAFVVAFGLQVDTPALVNRLAADEALRTTLVVDAQRMYAERQARESVADDPVAQFDQRAREMLSSAGIIRFPTSFATWLAALTPAGILGMLITSLLLSLGAPFWYSMLGRLLQLRSTLAVKDDVQRAERQLPAPAAADPQAVDAIRPPILAGERGDLAAIG